MELRHLRYFVTVAETCHFGRAAEQLHIAQPALSQAIRAMEAELGAPLFVRTTRQVALTPAGEFLLGEALRVLAAVNDSVRGVRRIAEGRLGQVRIGFTGTAILSHLPRIARTLRTHLPEIALEVHSDLLTVQQCDRLRTGGLELGVLRPPVRGEGIAVHILDVEPLVLAVDSEHRLALESRIAMADLRSESFISYAGSDSVVNSAVLRSCRNAGFSPNRELVATGTGVLLALVAGGLGIAVVPSSARALSLPGVVFRDLVDAETVELGLAWRRDSESALVRSVVETLTEGRTALPRPAPARAED
ncbi:LysR substrate-binding domain-containing protein [Nocardia sp. NPDC001965]